MRSGYQTLLQGALRHSWIIGLLFAGLLGGSRQRVNVELKWLEQQGLISVRPRGVEVHDAAGLQTLVDQAADEGKTGG